MDFAKMRQRIVFLKPLAAEKNAVGENVIGWYPYHPIKDIVYEDMHVTQGDDIISAENAAEFPEMQHIYGMWACVAPMNGREYAEAQKIRAETTYNITTRYVENIESNMKILYNGKIFDIVSILDVGGLKRELKIVASEVDKHGK